MVEQIESRGAEVQAKPLGQLEGLGERTVDFKVSRAAGDEATEVAPGSLRRKCKCRRIEPVGNSLIRRVDGHTGNQIRTLSGSVSVGEIRCLSSHRDIDRQARA